MDKRVKDYIPQSEILVQLAEEAAELAQAALKLRRAMDGTNPTPVSFADAYHNLIEEYSDVTLCLRELDMNYSPSVIEQKSKRWLKRLKGEPYEKVN